MHKIDLSPVDFKHVDTRNLQRQRSKLLSEFADLCSQPRPAHLDYFTLPPPPPPPPRVCGVVWWDAQTNCPRPNIGIPGKSIHCRAMWGKSVAIIGNYCIQFLARI